MFRIIDMSIFRASKKLESQMLSYKQDRSTLMFCKQSSIIALVYIYVVLIYVLKEINLSSVDNITCIYEHFDSVCCSFCPKKKCNS